MANHATSNLTKAGSQRQLRTRQPQTIDQGSPGGAIVGSKVTKKKTGTALGIVG